MREFTIGKNDAGQRLDRFVAKNLPLLPPALLQKYIRLKRIKVNGKGSKRDVRLETDDTLQLYINDEFFDKPNEENLFLTVFKPQLNIVYEDENLLLVDKRPGMSVHADETEKVNTLINHVQAYLYQKREWNPKWENAFAPALCNRIDRNTGGIVIAAKNAETLRIINEKIRAHELEKSYLCITVTIGILRYYPIVVDDFDMTLESNLTEWLLGSIAFSEAPFDYLVILSANDLEEITPTALQLSRQMLADVKKTIESEDYSLLEKQMVPYPVDVTAQMLNCFAKKYVLTERGAIEAEEPSIGDIAEELWIYSKSVELLTEPEDAGYLAAETQGIQTNISEMLRLLQDKLPSKDVNWLTEICNGVFSGKNFDDTMFNNVIAHFVQMKTGQKECW